MSETSQIIKKTKTGSNPEIQSVVSGWAETIAKEVAERRFYDVNEVAAYAKVKLAKAIEDCVKLHNDDLINKRMELVAQYTHPNLTHHKKTKLAGEIAAINVRIKERNKTLNSVEDYFTATTTEFKKDREKLDRFSGAENRMLIGKIHSIGKSEVYSMKAVRKFILCLGFNRKQPGVNESNYIECTLQKENCDIINEFSKGDIVIVMYNIIGYTFKGNNGQNIYAHTINVSRITKDE
jgi:hypothetical protein